LSEQFANLLHASASSASSADLSISIENDYVKAFACETCSGVVSTKATTYNKDWGTLLGVRR
jgi:hypothetical protein